MPTTPPNAQTPPSWYMTPTLSLIPSHFQSLATFVPPLKLVTYKLTLAIYLYTWAASTADLEHTLKGVQGGDQE